MAYHYERNIKLSVRDACGMMGDEKSNEYIDRVTDDVIRYCKKKWPGITVEFSKLEDW